MGNQRSNVSANSKGKVTRVPKPTTRRSRGAQKQQIIARSAVPQSTSGKLVVKKKPCKSCARNRNRRAK